MLAKLRFLLPLAGFLSLTLTGYTQEIIASGGEHFENAEGSVSWTIGKLVHETLSSGEFILSQGFHQPEVVVDGITDLPRLGLQLRAFPNPAHDQLQLEFTEGFQPGSFSIQLIDLYGRPHLEQDLDDPLTAFDFSKLPGGSYLLRIHGNGQAVHTFKVIKPR